MQPVLSIIFNYTGQTPLHSQVLSSEKFRQFMTECEESVNKLMAEVATKFYTLGFQEGRQIAVQPTIASTRIVSLLLAIFLVYMQMHILSAACFHECT